VRLQGLYYHEIRNSPLGRYLAEHLGPPPLGEHEGQLPVQLMRWVTLVSGGVHVHVYVYTTWYVCRGRGL
jgi:hypothetical protein